MLKLLFLTIILYIIIQHLLDSCEENTNQPSTEQSYEEPKNPDTIKPLNSDSANIHQPTESIAQRAVSAEDRSGMVFINKPPKISNQYSGAATVKYVLTALISPAPNIGPISVPRPPAATQTAISMELTGFISLGLIIPACGT